MRIILPIPPSINQTYGVKREVIGKTSALYKKKKVRDWEHEAGWEIKKQLAPKYRKGSTKDFKIKMVTYYKKENDIDAGIKVTLDLLEKMGVYKNDKQVKVLGIMKIQDIKNPRVEIDINEI